jgi:hypothetical protein
VSLVERRGIRDPWAPLFRRKGIDDQMGRADETLLHGRSSLNGQQIVHQGCVNAAATLGEHFRPGKMLLRAVSLDCFDATGVHDGNIGTQAVTDLVVRSTHLVLEQL